MASFLTPQALTAGPASLRQSEPSLSPQLCATLKIQNAWKRHADHWLILPSQLSDILLRELPSSSPYFPVTQNAQLIMRICRLTNIKIQLLKSLKYGSDIVIIREIHADHKLIVRASCASPPSLPPSLHLQIIDNSQIIVEGAYKELRKSVTVLVLFVKATDTGQKAYTVIPTVDIQSKAFPDNVKEASIHALGLAVAARHVYSILQTNFGWDLESHNIAPPFLSINFSGKNHALVCHLEQKRFDTPCLAKVIEDEVITINREKHDLTSFTALHLALRIVAGLKHFRAIGLGHGDVKPSNILIREDGEPLLTDFADYGINFFRKWCYNCHKTEQTYPFWSFAKACGFNTPFEDIYGAAITIGLLCLRAGFKFRARNREIAYYNRELNKSILTPQYCQLKGDVLLDYLFGTLDHLKNKHHLPDAEINSYRAQLCTISYQHQLSNPLSEHRIQEFATRLYVHLKAANIPDVPPILEDMDTLILIYTLVGKVAICDVNRFALLQNPSLRLHLKRGQLAAIDVVPFYTETFKITLDDIYQQLTLQIQRYQNL